ncbi:phage portal protein [Campylobacter sp. CNRCH_2015_0814]|uniref:phage portal protein n=1 Tax=Campylobacter sp. CNRCH_2015_0814 TaxID=2911606 RepID=UPI0021E6687F|nr:phage portal protein [Campylobacter sp. CNRCH_2015_0814]MCV3469923.1 phage portal protein [Campylobacter sp. CNRCH_2015_0814]
MLDKIKSFFKTQKRNQDYHTLEFLSEEKVNSDELSAVIAAISNISETIASLPLNLYKKEKNGSVLAINHPLFNLIKIAPNETMTPFTLIEAFMVQMLIYGNGFLYPMRKRNGQICSIELIENKDISLFKQSGKYFYSAYSSNGSVVLSYDEIVNVPYHTKDGVNGIAPLRKSKTTAKLATAIEQHGLSFFQNGAFTSGVITVPNELSDQAYDRLKKSFKENYSQKKAYNISILESGSTFTQTTSANKDSQFIESKQFQIIEIARLFNIPPHKLGDLSRATFSNIEQQETNYMVQTITPLTTKIEQAFNRFLLTKSEWGKYYFKFNINAILRADSASRWESYTKALNNGVMSINEVRALEEMNPISNGNEHLIALNLGKLNALKDEVWEK